MCFGAKFVGRGLTRDVPGFGLKGDRLEPGGDVWDVGAFEGTPTPFVCHLWRMGTTDRLLRDAPLWRIPGVTIDCIAIDILHAWHLGGLSDYIAFVIWFVIQSGIFTKGVDVAAEDAHKLARMRVKAELWLYYRKKVADDNTFLVKGTRVRLMVKETKSHVCDVTH